MSADTNEARNPQRFIHANVSQQLVKKVKKPKGDGRLTGKIKMNEGLKMGPKGVKQGNGKNED